MSLPVSKNTSFTVVIIGYEPPKLLSEDLMQSSSQEYEKKWVADTFSQEEDWDPT